MNAFADAMPPTIRAVSWPNFPKSVGLNALTLALSIMSSHVVKLRFIRLNANAASMVSSDLPPTTLHDKLINADVKSLHLWLMKIKGSCNSFKAGSLSKTTLAL